MSKVSGWCPERGEIVFIQHSPATGKEMPNLHPLLVSSPKAFNERTGIVIGFPMTHADYNADNPFAIAVQGPNGEVGYVLAFQPKSFDWKAREAKPHPWGGGHTKILRHVLNKLDAICGITDT